MAERALPGAEPPERLPLAQRLIAPGGALVSLRHRDFRVLLLGIMAFQIGSWVQTIGQGWLVVNDLDGSPFQLGLVAMLRGGSLFFFSPVAGYLAGRHERRRLLMGATFINALIAVALAVLIMTGDITIEMVYILAVAAGIVEGLAQPLRLLMVYDAVGPEDLTNAVALSALGQNAMRVIGPAIGGVLIGLVGTEGTFQLQAACLVLAVVLTWMLRPSPPELRSGEGFFRSIAGGMAYVVRDRRMLIIIVMAILPGFLVYPYVSFLPVYAVDVLNSDATAYGYLAASVGLGSLLGGVFVATRLKGGRMGTTMMWACFLYCLAVVAFTFTRHLPLALVALAVAGIFHSVYAALNSSLMQLKAEPEFRSRVLALQTMTFGITPFAALAMGEAIERWSFPPVVAIWVGVGAILTLVLTFGSREIRRV
ncbi:MAG: MFS transporter [Tepidiformaceae bacterium]